jgi:hypothetical protein
MVSKTLNFLQISTNKVTKNITQNLNRVFHKQPFNKKIEENLRKKFRKPTIPHIYNYNNINCNLSFTRKISFRRNNFLKKLLPLEIGKILHQIYKDPKIIAKEFENKNRKIQL